MSPVHPIGLIPLYALDALVPEERHAIEAHMQQCGSCRDELSRYRFAAASMVPDLPQPDHIWERVKASLA